MKTLIFLILLSQSFLVEAHPCSSDLQCIKLNQRFGDCLCVSENLKSSSGKCMVKYPNRLPKNYCVVGTDKWMYKLRAHSDASRVFVCEHVEYNKQPTEPFVPIRLPDAHYQKIDINGNIPAKKIPFTKPIQQLPNYMKPSQGYAAGAKKVEPTNNIAQKANLPNYMKPIQDKAAGAKKVAQKPKLPNYMKPLQKI